MARSTAYSATATTTAGSSTLSWIDEGKRHDDRRPVAARVRSGNGHNPPRPRARARGQIRLEAAQQVVRDGGSREPHREHGQLGRADDEPDDVRSGGRVAGGDDEGGEVQRGAAVLVR